jgi:hypothetical protein
MTGQRSPFHYCGLSPELSDVWTNHLLPFLLPSVVQMRQMYTIITYEMGAYHEKLYANSRILRYQREHIHTVHSCPIDSSHVLVTIKDGECEGSSRHLLHFNVDGHIHCVLYTYSENATDGYQRWTAELGYGHQLLCFDGQHLNVISYCERWVDGMYVIRGYAHEPRIQAKIQRPCLMRSLVLHGICQRSQTIE